MQRIPLEFLWQQTNPGFRFQPISLLADAGILPAFRLFGRFQTTASQDSAANGQSPDKIQNILKSHRNSSMEVIQMALHQSCPVITEDLALDVLKRNRSEWKLAYVFFKWLREAGGHPIWSSSYNEALDILGKMHRFEELNQVFDEMLKREGLANDRTFGILLNRFVAADKVEEAVGLFDGRKTFGIDNDLVAFQMLLMSLCRYKHVEYAETLFYSKRREFGFDIKTLNILLNGWCVLGDVREAKRFWKDILASQCKRDLFTYATFIKALTKKGKLASAMKLFRGMWEEGRNPDVVICNCMIDALCFKKRIPEALNVFREMGERGCSPNTVTYNSLIKHLCKIRRTDKVFEILDEMEVKGSCSPDGITFNYLLKSLKKPEEVEAILKRMERNGCKISCDTYNLILKLYIRWDQEQKVRCTWDEMERSGLGPDQRSYTIIIHGLYDKGKIREALSYFDEMRSKGMLPEPRTEILVNAMKEQDGGKEKQNGEEIEKSSRHKRGKKLSSHKHR